MNGISRRQVLAGAAAIVAGAAFARAADVVKPAAEPTGGPKFQLGLVTYNVAKDWDVPTILKVCRAAGIAAVELRTTHKHGVEPTLNKDQRAEVRKRFADSGVRLWGLGSVCEFHAADRAVVDKNIETCKQFVDLAADLGAAGVKVRPNGFPKGVPQEKTLEQIGKALVPCGDAAAAKGLEIWVEVHGPGTQEPAACEQIMKHCGHKAVGLTWNSNPTDVKDGSVADSFAKLKPWVRSCHINDLKNDAAKKYPYRELFKLFREAGYDRYTMCEVGTAYPDPEKGEAFLKEYKALWTTLANG
ncbi:MAG TPA: sugar phosphate isomerase/epimerase family protein [Humisphaera sp.]